MIIPIRIRHTEPIDQVKWHLQLQVAAKDDPEFASPLISRDTTASVANWFARVDQHDVDGVVEPVPADGVLTTKSASFEGQEAAAVLFAVLTQAEVDALGGATEVWIRARQSATQGASWGHWSTEPKLVPVEPTPDIWSAEQRDQVIGDLTGLVNDLGDVAGAVDAGFTSVAAKLDGLASDVAGVGDGVSTVDGKVDALNAEMAGLKVKLAAAATLAELTLTASQHLTLRQGAAYLACIGTALKVVLEV